MASLESSSGTHKDSLLESILSNKESLQFSYVGAQCNDGGQSFLAVLELNPKSIFLNDFLMYTPNPPSTTTPLNSIDYAVEGNSVFAVFCDKKLLELRFITGWVNEDCNYCNFATFENKHRTFSIDSKINYDDELKQRNLQMKLLATLKLGEEEKRSLILTDACFVGHDKGEAPRDINWSEFDVLSLPFPQDCKEARFYEVNKMDVKGTNVTEYRLVFITTTKERRKRVKYIRRLALLNTNDTKGIH
jgi:hypothetical protein